MRRHRISVTTPFAAIAVTALIGCGEKTFSAEDFVAEANDRGATLELGRPLETTDEDKKLYELRLEPIAEEQAASPEAGDEHSAGSLAAYSGSDEAEQGVQECEAAVDLLCYRAANVVIVLEGAAVGPEQVALAKAITEMAD